MSFLRLLLLVLSALPVFAQGDSAKASRHGIIHFYEPKTWRQPLNDVRDPEVTGAEAIFWWGDIEREEGVYDWSQVDRNLAIWQKAGKKLDLRLSTAHNSPFIAPQWLFDRYNIRRIGRGHWSDFENDLGEYILGPNGIRTDDPQLVVAGKFSIATLNTNVGEKILCRLNPEIRLEPGAEFSLGLDYRTTQSQQGWVEITSNEARFTNRLSFPAVAGQVTSQNFRIKIPAAADCQIRFGCDGSGAFAIDNLNLIRLAAEPTVQNTDFEGALDDWELSGDAKIIHATNQVISGHGSLLLNGENATIANRAPKFAIERGAGYAFDFNFRALTAVTLRYRIVSRDEPGNPLDEQVLSFSPGQSGHQRFYFPTFIWRDHCRVEFTVEGSGQVILDDLNWTRWSDRVACFPDYFNPVFQEKWEKFITAFARRYGENPAVGTISVGGFGRWEEVILDDDAYGGLDDQWLARGYTPEKYLARITDCLELYHRLLPHKALRICLAYGLYNQNHRDWLYRRVAQAAVARGIGLKQNGWSEKWDNWDDNTSASYLWNRYRFTPGITLTLETGGQIVRPGPGQGHPISFFNRGLIDGTDVLSLYGNDLTARWVHEYLRYVNEQAGKPLLTAFYCRLGDTSLTHENSSMPMDYRNLWLGLRQFQAADAEVIYTNRLGEMCAETSPGNPRIVFDMDDRQQYHGMFGVVVSVKYLDTGHDTFKVTVFNEWTGQWQSLGTVNKTGTGVWKTAAFTASDWCRSSRDTGEDVHADLVIDDDGDGPESIADVELQFVPAREWQRQSLTAVEPAVPHAVETNVLSREIEVPAGQALYGAAVPLWNEGVAANSVRGRVYAVTAAGEKLVADKQYTLPADYDWFEIPFVPEPGCTRYRIELSRPVGSIGWHLAADGTLAYRAWSYAEATNSPAVKVATVTNIFAAREPFFGLRFSADTNAEVRCVLHRELTGNGWSPAISEQAVTFHQGEATIYFEPQTAGNYQLELIAANGAVFAPATVTALQLVRREAALPALPFAQAGGDELFQPAADRHENLKLDSGLVELPGDHQILNLQVNSPSAGLELTPPSPFSVHDGQMLALQLRNHTDASFARIYWAGSDEAFSPARSALVPLVQNDTELREYHCTLSLVPSWTGQISRWRFEPASSLSANGEVGVGPIRVLNDAAFAPPTSAMISQ